MFDRKARTHKIEIGDKVLVKRKAFTGKHKISDRWESNVYKVVDRPNIDLPVYVVNGEHGEVKTLHRNMLHPVYFDDTSETETTQYCDDNTNCSSDNDDSVSSRPVTRSKNALSKLSQESQSTFSFKDHILDYLL